MCENRNKWRAARGNSKIVSLLREKERCLYSIREEAAGLREGVDIVQPSLSLSPLSAVRLGCKVGE